MLSIIFGLIFSLLIIVLILSILIFNQFSKWNKIIKELESLEKERAVRISNISLSYYDIKRKFDQFQEFAEFFKKESSSINGLIKFVNEKTISMDKDLYYAISTLDKIKSKLIELGVIEKDEI